MTPAWTTSRHSPEEALHDHSIQAFTPRRQGYGDIGDIGDIDIDGTGLVLTV